LKLTLRGHETKEAVSKGMHAIQHFGKRKGVLQNDKHATSFHGQFNCKSVSQRESLVSFGSKLSAMYYSMGGL